MRHEHGVIVSDGPEGRVEAATTQCCHCGKHYIVQPGSGRQRGYCFKCNAPTCGAQGCDVCLPLEKRLDLYEKGKILTL